MVFIGAGFLWWELAKWLTLQIFVLAVKKNCRGLHHSVSCKQKQSYSRVKNQPSWSAGFAQTRSWSGQRHFQTCINREMIWFTVVCTELSSLFNRDFPFGSQCLAECFYWCCLNLLSLDKQEAGRFEPPNTRRIQQDLALLRGSGVFIETIPLASFKALLHNQLHPIQCFCTPYQH